MYFKDSEKAREAAFIKNKIAAEEAKIRYYNNPNVCMDCGNIIHPLKYGNRTDYAGARIKKFCNQSCGAKFNNRLRERKTPTKKIKIIKERKSSLDNTKGQYKQRYSDWWSARVPIAKTARRIYKNSDKPKCCKICGYDKHYQVCHIKSVSEFDDSCTLREINDINNLVALCPNHHWEFDKGLINI